MNPAATAEFRENRAKFTLAELQKYANKWVAFSADGKRIVASGDSITEAVKQLDDFGLSMHDVAFDHIVIDDDIYLGGAEFL